MSKALLAIVLGSTALGACSWQGPALAGYPGLQYQVVSFYDDRAMERSASCPNPHMQSVTRYRIVEDTPDKVVMDINYYWVDQSQAVDVQGGSLTTCRDWGERTFTFARTSNGNLTVQSMTGEQRRG